MEIDAKNISFSYKLNKKKILTYKVHSFYQVLWKIKYAITETMEKKFPLQIILDHWINCLLNFNDNI